MFRRLLLILIIIIIIEIDYHFCSGHYSNCDYFVFNGVIVFLFDSPFNSFPIYSSFPSPFLLFPFPLSPLFPFSKVMKYPEIDDYRKGVRELDEKEVTNLRVCAIDLRNHYANLVRKLLLLKFECFFFFLSYVSPLV